MTAHPAHEVGLLRIWLKGDAGSPIRRAVKARVAPMFVVRFFKDGTGFICGRGGCSALMFTRRRHYQLTGKSIDGEPIYREKYMPMLTLEEIPKVYGRRAHEVGEEGEGERK